MHAGIRGKISRSPLADANKNRDWRIYAEEYFGVELDQTAYVFDSTTSPRSLLFVPRKIWIIDAGLHGRSINQTASVPIRPLSSEERNRPNCI